LFTTFLFLISLQSIHSQSCAASDLSQFNTEAMKLAALGVTIVVSSGDNGAANRVQNCNANSGSLVSPLWLVRLLGFFVCID